MSSDNLELTVLVLTLNEELNLPDCLQSIEPLGCEVLVVDSGSTDRTVELAKEAGAKVFEHPFESYGAQRNWAQDNLPIETEWLLHIDADERLTPEIRGSIVSALANTPVGINGFILRRRTVFMGRWIKHGGIYPSYHARLFRKDKGQCEDRLYDQHYIVDGKVERLSGDMIDITTDLSAWTVRHARWAQMEARELLLGEGQPGRLQGKVFGTSIERRRWQRQSIYNRFPLFVRAFLYFLYRYIIRLGFLDGRRGLVFHFLQGFWYRFQVDAYILESRRQAQQGGSSPTEEEGVLSLPKRKKLGR